MSTINVASASLLDTVTRPIANFPPSVWGDRFLNYSKNESQLAQLQRQVKELKEELKKELVAAVSNIWRQLELIDAIQRLGVSYHFEKEIEEALARLYDSHVSRCCLEEEDVTKSGDLYSVALWFRLLRQDGYKVSCDVFNKFKSNGANFKERLTSDARGLLSLYEAAHLSMHEEEILDEALAFTKAQLESLAPQLGYPMSKQVCHALTQPLHKGMSRVEARHYFPLYQANDSHNEVLLKLAALDFNLLQSLHQKELSCILRWWKDLDLATKYPFARERVVEAYFWVLGIHFEPKYSHARMMFVKVFSIASIIDDMYDAYGKLEELKHFTEAIHRWDKKNMDELPEYMKALFEAFLDYFYEIEEEMAKQGTLYKMHYAKQVLKEYIGGYFKEAEWCQTNYVPTMDEYMPVALITCGYKMLTTIFYIGMDEIATKEVFDWIMSNPLIIKASQIVCRLMDDMRSNQFEQEREHVASAVECYMKQYGMPEKEVREELAKCVKDAWKDINQAWLRPTPIPYPLLSCILNLTRVIEVFYKVGDGYTHVGKDMQEKIESLLVNPIVI